MRVMVATARIFVEEWDPGYGSPYLVDGEDEPTASLVEDGEDLRVHGPREGLPEGPPSLDTLVRELTDSGRVGLAFVDGVRRGEASLYQLDPGTGRAGRGIAGSHACGAVLVHMGGARPEFGPTRLERVVVWGSGLTGALPSVGGWSWRPVAIADEAPEAPLRELQERMRQAEATLAEELCAAGFLTVVDGPLHYVRSRGLPVIGYVKTHYRALLPPEHHARIPELQSGERTSLFAVGAERYSTYLRLAPRTSWSSPWSGIVRLEFPQSVGLEAIIQLADAAAAALPLFAGIPHRDPRAPQNLQPVGALEAHLRHLLGSPELARRAVREAVAQSGS